VMVPHELLEVARAHPRRERSIHLRGIPFMPTESGPVKPKPA
jgi:hypothetical protein